MKSTTTTKPKSRFHYAIGVDPGLKAGAMAFISTDLTQIELIDIKADSLEDSIDIMLSSCYQVLDKYHLPLSRVVGCVEDTNIFGGTGQSGKSTQMKNIGVTYAVLKMAMSSQFENGRNLRLVTSYEWKKNLGLNQTRQEDESAFKYQNRKKTASKEMAVQIFKDAGQVASANKLARIRPDFAEAVLMAIYALEPNFLDGHQCKVSRGQIAGATTAGTWLLEEDSQGAWKILCWDRSMKTATLEKLPGTVSLCDVDGSVSFISNLSDKVLTVR